MLMFVYSFLLTAALTLSAPWWAWRMLTSGRYRAGLAGRLGRVPPALKQACAGKRVIWVHAVSVGEVLAVTRLIAELSQTLGDNWLVALSTTTATGQQIARARLDPAAVFWFPLDFAFAVRPYLRALNPELVVLVEDELWPRVLRECEHAGIPGAVVNARVSDRSFRRTMRLRTLWLVMASKVTLWLAQSLETAERLQQLGIATSRIRTPGNLKYDTPREAPSAMARRIASLLWQSRLIIAGSTLPGEEALLLAHWPAVLKLAPDTALLIAPRHPDRFTEVAESMRASGYPWFRCSQLLTATEPSFAGTILLLDTLGDLATTYSIATAASIGGSLVPRGGHNPLEAARFGVPIVMGPSYENFREIVEGMRAADAILITDAEHLADSLAMGLHEGKPMGQRGQAYFEGQSGATARTVKALLELLHVHA